MIKSHFISSLLNNIRKDYIIEFRNKYSLNVSISFAIISALSISLAAGGISLPVKIQAVILWLILFFSAMNGLSHIFIREEEQGTSLFLKINTVSSVIFTSKLLFNIFLFFILQAVITPLYIFFISLEIKSYIPFILTVISGGLALSSSTTILAAITAKSGGRNPLFSIISFPIALPIIWAASKSTAISLNSTGYEGLKIIIFLVAFSLMIIVISYILFEYIWIEE